MAMRENNLDRQWANRAGDMGNDTKQKYSVLMTVYEKDRPEYLKLSLGSMVRQTHLPNEIVLVKDGPIPSELQGVIDNFNDCGIRLCQIQLETNSGLGIALNEGLKYVNNDLVARMDADDYSLPKRCELQIGEFEKNPKLDIIGCPVDEFIGDIDNVIGCREVPLTNEEIYKFAKKRDPFNHPTTMFRKSTVEKVGCYSGYWKNEDTDLWIRMLKNNAVCMNLEEHAFRFRFDERTYERRKSWMNTITLIEIRYRAWRSGFNSFFEFFEVVLAQLAIYILPIRFQKFLYRKILRR